MTSREKVVENVLWEKESKRFEGTSRSVSRPRFELALPFSLTDLGLIGFSLLALMLAMRC